MIEAYGRHKILNTQKLIDALDRRGLLQDAGGSDQLRSLAKEGRDREAAIAQAAIVVDKARTRRLIEVVSDILHDVYHNDDGYALLLSQARSRLGELDEAAGSSRASRDPARVLK